MREIHIHKYPLRRPPHCCGIHYGGWWSGKRRKTYANMYRIFMYMYISHILIYFPYVIPGAISLAKSGCLINWATDGIFSGLKGSSLVWRDLLWFKGIFSGYKYIFSGYKYIFSGFSLPKVYEKSNILYEKINIRL